MTKTFTTQFEPAEDETVDDSTCILIDGKEVAHIQHGFDGRFAIVEEVGGGFRWHEPDYPTLALATAAAKEIFAS